MNYPDRELLAIGAYCIPENGPARVLVQEMHTRKKADRFKLPITTIGTPGIITDFEMAVAELGTRFGIVPGLVRQANLDYLPEKTIDILSDNTRELARKNKQPEYARTIVHFLLADISLDGENILGSDQSSILPRIRVKIPEENAAAHWFSRADILACGAYRPPMLKIIDCLRLNKIKVK